MLTPKYLTPYPSNLPKPHSNPTTFLTKPQVRSAISHISLVVASSTIYPQAMVFGLRVTFLNTLRKFLLLSPLSLRALSNTTGWKFMLLVMINGFFLASDLNWLHTGVLSVYQLVLFLPSCFEQFPRRFGFIKV